MIETLPSFVSILFILTTIATLVLFYSVIRNSEYSSKSLFIVLGLIGWLAIQGVITLSKFYSTNTTDLPPKLFFALIPPLLTILILFATKKGRRFIDSLPLIHLTNLNIVRIPVELVLYWLCLNKAVPELMTFAGRNFDILSGITAPLVVYFGFRQQKLSRKVILIWNFIALALLVNIVTNAILSAPFAFQKFAFEQPNIAVLYFPFSWLPAFIVPTVLFGHLVSIRKLLKTEFAE